jgi:hypothetical protein
MARIICLLAVALCTSFRAVVSEHTLPVPPASSRTVIKREDPPVPVPTVVFSSIDSHLVKKVI